MWDAALHFHSSSRSLRSSWLSFTSACYIAPRRNCEKDSPPRPAFDLGSAGVDVYLPARGMAGYLHHLHTFGIAVNTHSLDSTTAHLSELHQYPLACTGYV